MVFMRAMYKNFVEEIVELQRPHVHIKNKAKVNELINALVNGGFKKLQAVFDFDQTITKHHENGKPHLSSFGMFMHCPSVSDDYKKQKIALRQKYYPLEHDPSIPIPEKKKLMEEWYHKSEHVIKGERVPQSEIDEVAAKVGPSLRTELSRDGSKQLFDTLYEANVPVLIFSAGLGDTVVSVLKHCNVYHPNVKVVSNFLKYGKDNVIEGFTNKLIHVLNKNEYALKDTEYYNTIQDRENVILMGDALGDVGMAEGIYHAEAVLKIGFLYEHVKDNLPLYMDAFDVVLEDDQTMNVVNSIIKYLS